eukprot:11948508-Alexandrium_andersonii.AAC.1
MSSLGHRPVCSRVSRSSARRWRAASGRASMASGSHASGPGALRRMAVRHLRRRCAARGWSSGGEAAGEPLRVASAGLTISPKKAWNCVQRCSGVGASSWRK